MGRVTLSKEKFRHLLNHLVLIFCVATVLYQVLFLIVPVRILMYHWNLTVLSSLLAVAGVMLFGLDLLTDRSFLRAKNTLPLLAVLGVMCISTVAQWKYGLSSNLKVIIWQLNQMLIIFPAYRRLTSQQWKRLMHVLYGVICAFYIPTVLASFVQFFTLSGTKVDIGGNLTRIGFQEGRLFGMFSGIYFSNVIVALLMIASVYYAAITKRRGARIAYILFAVLYGCHVILSGTRSVLVACMAATAFCLFLALNHMLRRKGIRVLSRTLVCLVAAVSVAAAIYLVDYGVGNVLKQSAAALNIAQNGEVFYQEGVSSDDMESEELELLPELERNDVELSNISNNRFTIWAEYLKLCAKNVKSLLLGYSPGGYMIAIREQYPELYIVQHIRDYYPQMYEKDLIYDAHNGYLLVLVNTGLLGVIAIAAFLALCIKQVLHCLNTQPKLNPDQYVLLALLTLILTAVFFDSDLFYKCTSTSVTFWLLAGLMLKSTEQAAPEQLPVD